VNYFFDTSALVKYYHHESGSEAVAGIIDLSENDVWILDIARVEFLSALHRRFRDRELSENELNDAIDGFVESLAAFHIEETGASVIQEAENLIKQYGKTDGLRTLDALHLAAFNLLAGDSWVFVSSDNRLCSVVEKLGYATINPLNT